MSKMFILALAASAAFAAPAMAYQLKSSVDGDQVRVSHLGIAKVDFSDPRQAKAIYAKVKRAAVEVCTVPSISSSISRTDAECVSRAVADAIHGANRPLLTAAYDGDHSANRALAGNDQ